MAEVNDMFDEITKEQSYYVFDYYKTHYKSSYQNYLIIKKLIYYDKYQKSK